MTEDSNPPSSRLSWPCPPRRELEIDELFAYAIGALDAAEEEEVMDSLAANPVAQRQLARIREVYLGEVPEPAPAAAPAPRPLAELVGRLRQSIKQGSEELVAGVELVAGRLQLALGGGLWHNALPQGALMRGADPAPAAAPSDSRIEIANDTGDRLALEIHHGLVDIHLRLKDAAATGTVSAFHRVERGEGFADQPLYISAAVWQGQAVLRGCPAGTLVLALQDSRKWVFVVSLSPA